MNTRKNNIGDNISTCPASKTDSSYMERRKKTPFDRLYITYPDNIQFRFKDKIFSR